MSRTASHQVILFAIAFNSTSCSFIIRSISELVYLHVSMATSDKYMIFAPELLGPDMFYKRMFRGPEESDRWDEMLSLKGMAEQCFASAQCY